MVFALLQDARDLRDKVWILSYFVSRLGVAGSHPFAALGPRARSICWHSSPARLRVSTQSGGLSAWYETSLQHVYAPRPDFFPQPDWTVVDVGANIGAYSAWVAGLLGEAGRLLAIEPNPVSFAQLKRSIGSVPAASTALGVACGEVDGELVLYSEPGYTVSSSFTAFELASRSDPVRVRRLDDISREHDISHVDLLKIDVEGAEALVLRGAEETLARTDRVILETTADDLVSAVTELLHAHGFELVHRESDHWSIKDLEILAFRRASGP